MGERCSQGCFYEPVLETLSSLGKANPSFWSVSKGLLIHTQWMLLQSTRVSDTHDESVQAFNQRTPSQTLRCSVYDGKNVVPLLHLAFKQPTHNGKSLQVGNWDLKILGKE